jgi:integrase
MKIDIVGIWLNSVSISHSQSKATEEQYKRVWGKFTSYIETTADKIIADFNKSDDRTFKKKYSELIRTWINHLSNPDDGREPISNHSIKVMVGAVKSFFKYNDLPLGHIPQATNGIIYHNRDITKEEILQIMVVSKPREKAFFAFMAQSGLRPYTIRQLKLKDIESLDKIPCKINIPKEIAKGKFGSYVTFVGPDSTKYLKQYFDTRTNLTDESFLFCAHDDPNKPIDEKAMSHHFRFAVRKLEECGALSFEIRKNKPSELRLYNLRKFFKKFANQMGDENVEYLMGHTVRGSAGNYKPKDPEFYREQYKAEAMPFLALETPTPTENTNIIKMLEEKHQKEIEEIKNQYENKIKTLEDRQKIQETEQSAISQRIDKWEEFAKEWERQRKENPKQTEIQDQLNEEQQLNRDIPELKEQLHIAEERKEELQKNRLKEGKYLTDEEWKQKRQNQK